MTVFYTAHAESKLSTRRISKEDVERVISEARQNYDDVEHYSKVAIGRVDGRHLVVVYQMVDSDMKIITPYNTHKLDKLLSSKTMRGVWRKTV